MRAPRVSLLALALLLPAFAGCLSSDEPPSEPEPLGETNASEVNATLPDDRGEAIAFQETNATEEGAGGVEHLHDYWGGAERVDVFVGDVSFFVTPVYPDGEGSQARSIAYIKLPPPNLIYEGASEVQILVQAPTLDGTTPMPVAPALTLTYRTASSDAFVDGGAITYAQALVLPVAARETDMPHSVSSLWAFALKTDKPEMFTSVNVTITAIKGSKVVDWPGHPDFYKDRSERVVMDADLNVHRQGIEEGLLYGTASSWTPPEKLISYGTGYLDVFVNISSASSSNGAPPTGFFLEYHDATILDAEDSFNDRIDDTEGGRAYDDEFYHFVVPVTAEGMDGPYQPSSRWGFRMVATFAETPAASLCPGCFAYDIEYHMTIVAHEGEDAARIN